MTDKKELELYLHIPFCIRKCNYCDFLSMPADEGVYIQYADMLLEELKEKASVCREYQAITVFLGGGTPSLLPEGQISRILGGVQEYFSLSPNAEVTIECNPGTLDRQKLSAYQKSGVNRLSIGLQSAINQELGLLGRIHTFQQFEENFALARDIGFQNINIDLISGLPRQTLRDWEYTLEKVMDLEPEHISAYSLIVEPGTPFYETYGEDEQRREQGGHPQYLPEEETERDMYQRTKALLEEKGYRRYEISNYARQGRECRHNIGYWRRTPYLGFGLGSASLLEETRFSNPSSLKEYLEGNYTRLGPVLHKGPSAKGTGAASEREWQERQTEGEGYWKLSREQQMEEFMFLGLRMAEGVSKVGFQAAFGINMEGAYGKPLQEFQKQGLLAQQGDAVFLTEEGIAVSNYVLGGFLL
ncbi:hypothetical protein C810_02995 [Lachnospiraceae bacterium A2]|nr:hypothetical protein C810_02995 [Lachnospiraceae bacterium A2]